MFNSMYNKMKKFNLVWFLCMIAPVVKGSNFPCSLKDYGSGNKVCVCNATYCDTIDSVLFLHKDEIITYISSEEGLRFNKTTLKFNKTPIGKADIAKGSSHTLRFVVNATNTYQKMMGFGGAFTDAAAINIRSLRKKTQKRLLASYFSEKGIEYNLCRVPIGGTDFSTRAYSYDDGPADPTLENFSLAEEDLKLKIPLIKEAMKMSVRDIRLEAALWSPPTWMKSANSFSGFALLKKEYYDSYAKYLIRFLDEYKKHKLDIWAISTGNEPSNGLLPKALSTINSLGWTPSRAADWIVNYFGPQLRSSVHNQTLMLAFDDQRLFLPWWIDWMVGHKKDVLQYIDGFSVHWYWDFFISEKVIKEVYKKYPDKFVLYTEASMGDKHFEKRVDIGSWKRGERYISNIIKNVNSGVTGWMDWNLALNLNGGPNWIGNFVDSPILVNASADEFYKQPMFYAMGHVSKFIEWNARNIQISPIEQSGVYAMAVKNPDGKIVIIMVNENDKSSDVSISGTEQGWINLELPSHSFVTMLWQN